MRHRSLVTAVAVAAFLSLTLAGCSSDKAAAKLDPAASPLSEYMSAMNQGYDEETMLAQQNDREELIANCMADEGFDYVPVDNAQYSGMVSADDGEEYGTEKWVAENGYGMSQSPEQIAEQQAQSEEFIDPNQDYVMSLSEGEQAAYYEVLYGVQPTEEEMGEDGSYEYNWQTSGCQGFASHEIDGDQPSQEEHAALYEAMSAMYETSQASPTLVKLDSEWAACMADAGYATFTKKADAQESIMNEQNALYENQTGTGPDEKVLAEMREKELTLAMADFTCAEEVDYTDASMQVQFDLEEQFIIDHKTELDALIADSEQGK
jgi:outer membrane murein-binding lipoprotein Lpp